ncbi:hypothetical protein [Mucilaginibacter defluvii]|uniref:Uncharacterized protein n=1 Tax=Mucilaginibacter defluvii TaxID=1196019 RepID=A0ABP9FN80_9SPHI
MKKLVFIALFSAAFSFARAQHIVLPQPNTSNNPDKIKITPIDTNKVKPQPNQIVAMQFGVTNNDIIVYSRMPVKKIQGFNSKTPISGKGNKITGYNMPVKRVQIINTDTAGKVKVTP